MCNQPAGFCEIEHTADWELKVWAPDFPRLLEQSARGMYSLMGLRLESSHRLERKIIIEAVDRETTLVDFLNELLFIAESQSTGFDEFQIEIEGLTLTANLRGTRISAVGKEIKAVTYHNLAVQNTSTGLIVNLVFDV